MCGRLVTLRQAGRSFHWLTEVPVHRLAGDVGFLGYAVDRDACPFGFRDQRVDAFFHCPALFCQCGEGREDPRLVVVRSECRAGHVPTVTVPVDTLNQSD